jgi:hypothetical protein
LILKISKVEINTNYEKENHCFYNRYFTPRLRRIFLLVVGESGGGGTKNLFRGF